MLQFNFRAGYNIRCEGVPGVGNIWRLCERHGYVGNPGILRSAQQLAKFCRELWANLRHKLSRNRENDRARSKGLLLTFDFRFDMNARRELLDMQDPCFRHDTHPGSHRFRNAIDTIRNSPLPAHEQVPDDLHQDHARRRFH